MLSPISLAPVLSWRSQKPPIGVGIERYHGLARGLEAFALFRREGRIFDVLGKCPASPLVVAGGSVRWVGEGLLSQNCYVPLTWPKVTGPFTLTMRFLAPTWDTAGASNQNFFGGYSAWQGGGVNRGIGAAVSYNTLYFNLSGVSTCPSLYVTSWSTVFPAGRWATISFCWDGTQSSSAMSVWKDGRLLKAGAVNIAAISWTSSSFYLFRSNSGGSSACQATEFVALHSRKLSLEELRLFHTQPYCMFEACDAPSNTAFARPLVDGSPASGNNLSGVTA